MTPANEKKQPRSYVPKALREAVESEYERVCAICGKPSTELHHIDEDPSNSISENLIPLCSAHHQRQTRHLRGEISPAILRLFRLYDRPQILYPQFKPLADRLAFLATVGTAEMNAIESQGGELVAYVGQLNMGKIYSPKVWRLILPAPTRHFVMAQYSDGSTRSSTTPDDEGWAREIEAYKQNVSNNRGAVEELVCELSTLQDWPAPAAPDR